MDDQPLSPSRPVMRYHGGKYRLADSDVNPPVWVVEFRRLP